jgi:hypothetical protein
MPDIHTIRLRHPWACELEGALAIWSRPFNWPAGLVAREVVWLVIDTLPAEARVEFNGQSLTADEASGRFDVTPLIAEHNRLSITVTDPTGAKENRCPLDVRLEIDEG